MKASDVTYDWLIMRHHAASNGWGDWQDMCLDVETVYKGDFTVPKDVEGLDIEIAQPTDGLTITRKFEQMLGIRREIRFRIPHRARTNREATRADKLERVLRGFFTEHKRMRQSDVLRDGVPITLLRGRGGWTVRYNPNYEDMPIEVDTFDTFSVYPVMGKRGVEYVVREYYMTPLDVELYFEGITDPELMAKKSAALDSDPKKKPSDAPLRVIEYWDDTLFAWSLGGQLIDAQEHGYGFCPYIEARINRTILDDKKWQAMGLLAGYHNDIKQLAAIRSKMVTNFELHYMPMLLYKNPDGALVRFDPYAPPGTWQEVAEDFQPIILNPTANQEAAMTLFNQFNGSLYKGTLSEITFVNDIPDASGFLVSNMLSIIQDQIADYRDAFEMAYSHLAGMVLRMMEYAANASEDGAIEVLTDAGLEKVTADDIDGDYRVLVNVKVSLPQDKLQKTTTFNQMYQRDQNGMLRFDLDTALEYSGIAEDIGDVQAMKERIELDYLLTNDQQAQALRIEALRAKFFPELKEMQKDVEKAQTKQERDALRQEERAIEKGESEAVILPPEIANNPQLLSQLAAMSEQGIPASQAVNTLMQGALPLGVPGQPPQGGEDDEAIMSLMQALTGGGGAPQQMPDGMSGYGGVAPAALPPAMQGALPRQSVDRDNLMLEQVATDMRRGALPPAR